MTAIPDGAPLPDDGDWLAAGWLAEARFPRGPVGEPYRHRLFCDRLFEGYRQKPSQPAVVAAEAALRGNGYEPSRVATGGGSDANVLVAEGFPCVNLANGTERNHEPTERVSVDALEGMLDVALCLLDEAAAV